ncbi:MAG: hypothetical protein WCA77_07405 [Thermoplasmata archaeon]
MAATDVSDEIDGPRPKGILGRMGFPEPTSEERKEAIADPGPSWREYFFYSFLKVWIALGLLILDAFVAGIWFHPINLVGLVASLAAALFLEFLLYRYLWYRPAIERSGTRFKRSILRPVPYGRWTPEAERVHSGLPAQPPRPAAGPDPREFL